MKRFYTAVAFCVALLVIEGAYLLTPSLAKDDVVGQLLRLPSPPPPNPALNRIGTSAGMLTKDGKPPSDDAPIADILAFWGGQSVSIRALGYVPDMSDKTLERIEKEVERDPVKLPGILGSLKDSERAAEFVKRIYDSEGSAGVFDKETRRTIKQWLVYHSNYFADELGRLAQRAGDSDTYVTGQEELLQLTRFDFDRARPVIDRLYNTERTRASRSLARWALYRHALESGSTGDADRYRDELKEIVEDKTLPAPTRDLAMDALVTEKEWPGRDEWYYSLLGDETLQDMGGYTGLTTLINVSPPDKYVDKMIELVRTGSPTVRAAAIRNLISRLNTNNPELIRTLVPWLEDPKWANDTGDTRLALVRALRETKIPESVPGLMKMLDEKTRERRPVYSANSVNAANAAAPAARMTNAAVNAAVAEEEVDTFKYRMDAVGALGNQGDPQAIGPLRRMLNLVEMYSRGEVVGAVLKCKGFTLAEQVDAFESIVKRDSTPDAAANSPAANSFVPTFDGANIARPGVPPTAAEIKALLGAQLSYAEKVEDDFAFAIVDRIEALDGRDPALARSLRKAVIRYQNPAFSLLFLRDVKRDRADVSGVTRLLGTRRLLRETMPSDVSDLRTGPPMAIAIAACLMEDQPDYTAILDGDNAEAKATLFACARLIRAPLPLAKSAELARGGDKRLAYAAELYLESEDSPEARAVVLSLHPGEAKILGATTAFFPDNVDVEIDPFLYLLFMSVDNNEMVYNGWTAERAEDLIAVEKRLRDEVKKDAELLGVYGYDKNYIRIYADRVIYSWEEDDSRYRERPLEKEEFDAFKSYLAQNRVDEIPPFAQCSGPYCEGKELVMLSRNGGRRVYYSGEVPAFFVGMDKFFADVKRRPSTVKYALSRELPGLELLLADDALHVETVWKDGDDLRVAVSEAAVRKKVNEEIEDAAAGDGDGRTEAAGETDAVEATPDEISAKLRRKRQYEGYSWRRVVNGTDAGFATQPAGVEFIPIRDGMPAQPTIEQWRARLGGVEWRSNDDGIYKVSGGRAVRVKEGSFGTPLVTPNGRWCIAAFSPDDESGAESVARVNLVNGRMDMIDGLEGYRRYDPAAYLANINRVLLVPDYQYYQGYEVPVDENDSTPADPDPSELKLLNPDTGAVQEVVGEVRPLAQQTFRPLQKAAVPGTFWAAMPDMEKNQTAVGLYDQRTFSFRTMLTVPKIAFNSMSMWLDEANSAVYFVYRGHLLKLPFRRSG